ncbi:hypothetical protein [Oceanobacillus sp. CAU 1775]
MLLFWGGLSLNAEVDKTYAEVVTENAEVETIYAEAATHYAEVHNSPL